MIVVVAGMYRSGSTFSFNVIRESLIERGTVLTQAGNSIPSGYCDADAMHLILKSHAPDEACTALVLRGDVHCICTYRRPEDAIASWMRAFNFGLDDSIEMMRQWLAWHARVSTHTLNIAYEKIDRRPLSTIFRIQRWLVGRSSVWNALHLWWKYDKRRLKVLYDQLAHGPAVEEIGFSYFDRNTFFHRRHIGSVSSRSATQLLVGEDVLQIRQRLSAYVDAQGNFRPSTAAV